MKIVNRRILRSANPIVQLIPFAIIIIIVIVVQRIDLSAPSVGRFAGYVRIKR